MSDRDEHLDLSAADASWTGSRLTPVRWAVIDPVRGVVADGRFSPYDDLPETSSEGYARSGEPLTRWEDV